MLTLKNDRRESSMNMLPSTLFTVKAPGESFHLGTSV